MFYFIGISPSLSLLLSTAASHYVDVSFFVCHACAGQLCARTLLDERILDLPLSPVFLKAAFHPQHTLSFDDLKLIDPGLHTQLATFQSLCTQKEQILGDAALVR